MTDVLHTDQASISRAVRLLADGRLVAFPTETVYGLGADARNGRAVAQVYAVKGRPSFNPLIVHVSDRAMADLYGVIPPEAEPFLQDGWPAGLTLVVPLRENAGLASLVTAGLTTVAIRVPVAPVAQTLLKAFGGPVAAPSANPSGRVSPTTAAHVLNGLGSTIAAVIDGGPTEHGLESTILGFPGPVVLREGAYPVPDDMDRQNGVASVNAPGQLASHYAPKARVRLNATEKRGAEWHLGFGAVAGDVSLSPTGDLAEAAANLFALLHRADAKGVAELAVAPIPDTGLGRAINDRLRRASAPRD